MLIAIHKPPGPTSYDIIRKIKRIPADSLRVAYGSSRNPAELGAALGPLGGVRAQVDAGRRSQRTTGTGSDVKRIRVGHAGTLDPFAEGVLVVGIGRESTKKLGELSKNAEKEYIATLELGRTSTTGDPEGALTETAPPEAVQKLARDAIGSALQKFTGEITQTPPAYSAVKIKGIPAYALARRGEIPELKPRTVTIHALELLDWAPPFLKLKIVCSSGTYIRSLGADIGRALGTGAYVKTLLRTRVGEFTLENTLTL